MFGYKGKFSGTVIIWAVLASCMASCHSDGQDEGGDGGTEVQVEHISDAMAKVRDYVPLYAVVAHRGSTYWAPEETEAAWRWARETGADYLESDLQASKDGIVLANHDESLQRTTDIDRVYGDSLPASRADFYRSFRNADGSQAFTEDDIRAQCLRDRESFVAYRTMSYYYHELLALDAGAWFNKACPQQARQAFAADGGTHLYVSALQDQMAYARGKMLRRGADGERMLPYAVKKEYRGMTLEQIYNAQRKTVKCDDSKVAYATPKQCMDFVEYDFADAYTDDPQDTGNRPGLYIEFKKPALNPEDMEVRVYNLLAENGWNIMTKPEGKNAFYVGGRVNVGNTNGKVVMQTFSKDALERAYTVFGGRVPMCYLLWKKSGSDAPAQHDTPEGYAAFIDEGLRLGAHIMGPSIAGEPNNYEELDSPWQAALIRRAGMLNHPYTFDTLEQTETYTGSKPQSGDSRYDGLFTNRSDLTLGFLIAHGLRCNAKLENPFGKGAAYDNAEAPSTVPDAQETLKRLGY